MAFTVVFEGDLMQIEGNPFKVDTPFGRPVAIADGDALGEELREYYPSEDSVEAGARVLAKTPAIESPKLGYQSWMGLARSVLRAGRDALQGAPLSDN